MRKYSDRELMDACWQRKHELTPGEKIFLRYIAKQLGSGDHLAPGTAQRDLHKLCTQLGLRLTTA